MRYLALGLALAAAIGVSSCSSSSNSTATGSSSSSAPSSSPPSSSAAPSSAAPEPTSGSAATAAITTNWEAFFSGTTTAAQKIALLQNGQLFATIINNQAGSSLSQSVTAKVTSVTLKSGTTAAVTYNILLGSSPALSSQAGTAVYENGTWKVGDVSFCVLLTLENAGTAPSVCKSAG
jgi:hypothetical protein